jgi:hypothetical protein
MAIALNLNLVESSIVKEGKRKTTENVGTLVKKLVVNNLIIKMDYFIVSSYNLYQTPFAQDTIR